MKVCPVPLILMQRITDYLVTRPYCEVADFVVGLSRLKAEERPDPPNGTAKPAAEPVMAAAPARTLPPEGQG